MMSHEEATGLLASYALGALDERVEDLEAHVHGCAECTKELQAYLETTAELASALPAVAPPAELRARVLAQEGRTTSKAQVAVGRLAFLQRIALPAAAVLAVLTIGLGAGDLLKARQLATVTSQAALQDAGLALLTSTETSVDRLVPTASVPQDAHGHFYRRAGIDTMVLVAELLPATANGTAYFGWLRHADGTWQATGPFTLDARGYGRIVLVGRDGSDVRQAQVTLQRGQSAQPGGTLVLQWPAS
jgi:hypothetical protein